MLIKKQSMSGRSMIEMLGVLVIIGILSAGGIAGYNMAMQKHRTNMLQEKIQLIVAQTKKAYKGNYTNNMMDNLISIGYLDNSNNPFGGNITLGNSAGPMFYVRVPNVPSEACVGVLKVTANNPLFEKATSTGSATINSGADLASIISFCKGADKQISFYFR